MPEAYSEEEINRKWNEMEDAESASAQGVRYFDDVLRGRLDPIRDLDLLLTVVEAAWDGPHGNIAVVHEGLLRTEILAYDAERRLKLGAPDQITLHAKTQTLLAKSWHRKENYKQATLVAYAVIRRLEDIVDRKGLREVVARPTASAIAEAVVEVFGIYVASLRRAESRGEFSKEVAKDLRKVIRELMLAYLGPELCPRVIYRGTASAAGQWFYSEVHNPLASEPLVRALYQLDVQTRPDQRRSRVTAHARDAEFAAYLGERARARREARSLVDGLERVGMLRHLATIKAQAYFSF